MKEETIIKKLQELLETMCNDGDLQTAATVGNALDLINRQRAEIEGLKIANEKMYVANKEQEAEIDKLCIEIDELIIAKDLLFDEAKALILKAKAEAIQGFADRLKENTIEVDVSFGYGKEHYTEAVTLIEIDNLVKEMLGEQG